MIPISIPALRGKIGNTIFYSTNLSFKQIKELIVPAGDQLYTAKSLKELIQRSLSDNHLKIRDYILNREDRFFDSLVLAIYDGDPKWTEIRYELNDVTYPNVGLLELSGQEKIFPVDGQHRVAGIKAAMEINPELEDEIVNVMLIGHTNTPEGRERSRRIFSTLNRYVKPVRLGDIIALDEDDIVAIVTRDMLETYPLLSGNRVKLTNSKAVNPNDFESFTSLMTLYDCHKELYHAFISLKDDVKYTKTQLAEKLKYRPDDATIDSFRNELVSFWDIMRKIFPEFNEFIDSKSDKPAWELRSKVNGGNIFFRPIGLLPFIEAVVRIRITHNQTFETILKKYSNMNRIVSSYPWDNILWNRLTNRMVMRNQSLVKYLLIKMYDSKLLSQKEEADMINKYATVFNISKEIAVERISATKLVD